MVAHETYRKLKQPGDVTPQVDSLGSVQKKSSQIDRRKSFLSGQVLFESKLQHCYSLLISKTNLDKRQSDLNRRDSVYQAPRMALFQGPTPKTNTEKREIGFVSLINYFLSTDFVSVKEIKKKNQKHPSLMSNPKVVTTSYLKQRESLLRESATKIYSSLESKKIVKNIDEVCFFFS